MKKKPKDNYKFQHLSLLYRRSNWVHRDNPYLEYLQFPDNREDFREEIDRRLMSEHFHEMLETLTYRERHVIYYRIYDQKTLDEAAAEFCVSRERIRQVEAKALRKLRHPRRYAMVLEPEELRRRELERAKREAEKKRLEDEAEAKRKKEYEDWWNAIGRAEHEEKERIRKANRARLQAEAEEMHNRAREAYERKQKELRDRVEVERGLQRVIDSQRTEQEEAQRKAAIEADKTNDNRPYIWDAYLKRRRYLNNGRYE